MNASTVSWMQNGSDRKQSGRAFIVYGKIRYGWVGNWIKVASFNGYQINGRHCLTNRKILCAILMRTNSARRFIGTGIGWRVLLNNQLRSIRRSVVVMVPKIHRHGNEHIQCQQEQGNQGTIYRIPTQVFVTMLQI